MSLTLGTRRTRLSGDAAKKDFNRSPISRLKISVGE